MTIMEMARLVADTIAEGAISVKVEPESSDITGYAKDTALRMSGEKLRKLGWTPVKVLEDMYKDVLETL